MIPLFHWSKVPLKPAKMGFLCAMGMCKLFTPGSVEYAVDTGFHYLGLARSKLKTEHEGEHAANFLLSASHHLHVTFLSVQAREPELTVLLYDENGELVHLPLVSSGLAELDWSGVERSSSTHKVQFMYVFRFISGIKINTFRQSAFLSLNFNLVWFVKPLITLCPHIFHFDKMNHCS